MARNTPAPVARLLRQEAGFGCCACGIPILQYHHIVEWADDHHFRPEDMMVLCPTHHDQATKGAMSEVEQRALKAAPFNIQHGMTKGMLAVKQNYCAANFGTVTVVGEGPFLRIDGEDMIGFELEDGVLQVSLRLFNESDEVLLEIRRNEWIAGNPLPWDIQADWQKLKLNERARQISLDLDLQAIPLELRGKFWRAGKSVTIDGNGISIDHKAIQFQELAFVGMVLEVDSSKLSFGPPPGSESMIISWPNRRERLWRAKDAWLRLRAKREAAR
jgi:hypothetical protein